MSKKRLDALMSSETNEWLTPPSVLRLVQRLGAISLDPCFHPAAHVPAEKRIIFPAHDGLKEEWSAWAQTGIIWVNPPYGRALSKWAKKIQREARAQSLAHPDREILVLVPARVDTGWWDEMHPDAWCAWKGRIRFLRPGGKPADAPTFPSALLYFGRHPGRFAEVFGDKGRIYYAEPPAPDRQLALIA